MNGKCCIPVGEESHEPAHSTSSQFNGAVDELSQGLKCERPHVHQKTAHTQDTQSIQQARWKNSRRRFKKRVLTYCDAEIMSARATDGQLRGQFKGALDASSRNVQKANTLPHPHSPAHTKHTLSSAGRWMTVQGRFKMQAPTSHCAHTRQDTVNSAGRWMTVQGMVNRRAHTSYSGNVYPPVMFNPISSAVPPDCM